MDFLSRLASLIPKPRVNLVRFHGVFAPHFKYRALVVPEFPQEEHSDTLEVGKSRSMSWAQRLKRVFGIDMKTCSDCGGKIPHIKFNMLADFGWKWLGYISYFPTKALHELCLAC